MVMLGTKWLKQGPVFPCHLRLKEPGGSRWEERTVRGGSRQGGEIAGEVAMGRERRRFPRLSRDSFPFFPRAVKCVWLCKIILVALAALTAVEVSAVPEVAGDQVEERQSR